MPGIALDRGGERSDYTRQMASPNGTEAQGNSAHLVVPSPSTARENDKLSSPGNSRPTGARRYITAHAGAPVAQATVSRNTSRSTERRLRRNRQHLSGEQSSHALTTDHRLLTRPAHQPPLTTRAAHTQHAPPKCRKFPDSTAVSTAITSNTEADPTRLATQGVKMTDQPTGRIGKPRSAGSDPEDVRTQRAHSQYPEREMRAVPRAPSSE